MFIFVMDEQKRIHQLYIKNFCLPITRELNNTPLGENDEMSIHFVRTV